MTVMWLIDLHGRAGSKYLAIADAISESVADGSLPAGAKLPPENKLAYDLGLETSIVSKAYQEAGLRGVIEKSIGGEMWVCGARLEISTERISMKSHEDWVGYGDATVVAVVLCSPTPAIDDPLVGRPYPSTKAFDLTPKGVRYGEWW